MPNITDIFFNYYTISLLIGGFTALISGFLVYVQNKRRDENQAWFALTLTTAIWSFSYFLMTVAEDIDVALLSNKILHYAAIFIPLFYFLLVLTITQTYDRYKKLFYAFSAIAIFFVFFNNSSLFIDGVMPKVGFNFAPVAGEYYILFFFYFILLVTSGIIVTIIKITRTHDRKVRLRLLYTIAFTLAAAVGGGSVFATTFSQNIPPYLLILFSIYPAISGYAILKFQLFEAKVIATQIITYGLWTFIFVRILISDNFQDRIVDSILLVVVVIFGLLLIRGVKKEVQTREKIERLATDLSNTNERLASANSRLKELDTLKSEFVSLATHQIRSPLSAIKGYVSLIMEGDYGKIPKDLNDPLDKIFKSTQNLVVIVEDFLNISRIELGRMKYEFVITDISDLVKESIDSLKPNIDDRGLALKTEIEEDIRSTVDTGKIRQVFSNLIDNAIKYTEEGSLTVKLTSYEENKMRFSIKDTGIGVDEETKRKLFQKFSRAKDASKTNIMGAGLGLYVASEMVKAHNGKIWVESEGRGKGSTFIVELEKVK
ncbi:MAG: hypothetical protein COV70_03055 [Parcubacteria group bacterium CG11_big_fil_rev_8_21_14_0_20_39_22]|nr:MAG: hypothetical protein COV70_03055 [Parcubacteria group bacterium CG11_big_fil_rev_8_21_14_0_20_39_22]